MIATNTDAASTNNVRRRRVAAGPTYVRMYCSDWRSGCIGLTLEQEGLYIRACMFIAETGRRIPLDDAQAAQLLHTQTRNYRRVLGELLRIGKIKRHHDGYGNDRIEYERDQAGAKAAAADQRSDENKLHPAPPGISSDWHAGSRQKRATDQPSIGDNADVTTKQVGCNDVISRVDADFHVKNQYPPIEPRSKIQDNDVDASGVRLRFLPDGYLDRLVAALGGIAENPVNASGLLDPSVPLMWLNEGCCFDRDVIPAIEKIARAKAGRVRVGAWSYFNKPIAEAKRRRIDGLPPAQLPAATPTTPETGRSEKQRLQDETFAIARRFREEAEAAKAAGTYQ